MIIQISRIQHWSLIKYWKKQITTKYISYFENKLKFEWWEIDLTMEDEVFIDWELHITNKRFYRKSRAKKTEFKFSKLSDEEKKEYRKKYMKEYYKKVLINK